MATVRWNVAVSAEIDQAVRLFVAARGGGRKGDLSRFIEEVMRAYLLDQSLARTQSPCAPMSAQAWESLVDEAVEWARRAPGE